VLDAPSANRHAKKPSIFALRSPYNVQVKLRECGRILLRLWRAAHGRRETAPTFSRAVTEPEQLQRITNLQAYLERAFDRERERFRWAEEKVARYAQILVLIVGGGAVGAPEAYYAVRHLGETPYAVFAGAYAVGGVALAVAMIAAWLVSGTAETAALPVDDNQIDLFLDQTHPYATVMRTIAVDTYQGCIEHLRKTNKRRFFAARWVFGATGVALLAGVTALTVFILFIPPGTGRSPDRGQKASVTTGTSQP